MNPNSLEVFEWHIYESLTPKSSPFVHRVMHMGPFASEEECRALLANLNRIPRFSHGNLEVHKRQKQRQRRIKIKLPVQVCRPSNGCGYWPAHTVDIASTGARLLGLGDHAKLGDILEIRCGRRQAVFRVIWVGVPRTPSEGQIGVEFLVPENNFWGLDLSERTDDEPLLQELAIARAVQSKLLPLEKPPLRTLDYSGDCVQAYTVGGDYYDFLDMGPGQVGFVLADVAGKGVGAGLLMANLQGSMHSRGSGVASQNLPQLLSAVNHHLYKHTEAASYASLFFGFYDDATRSLQYVNCGHAPPLLLRQCGSVERLAPTATVLGLFHEWECQVGETHLDPGSVLSIFTDGVTETTDHNGEEFGETRLLGILRESQHLEAAAILQKVEQAVGQFRSSQQMEDDLTLVIARAQ
jgi:hypothetical protein